MIFSEHLSEREAICRGTFEGLQPGQSLLGEEVFAVGVVVGEDATDAVFDGGDASLDAVSLADQATMILLTLGRAVGGGNHVEDEEFSQNLGIELVAFAS